jgi:hypothetical protein
MEGATLSWADNDTYMTTAINFSYSSMEFEGSGKGKVGKKFSRGHGLLEHFNSLPFGQNIIQGNLPKSIQEAIDTYSDTKVILNGFNNTINKFNSIF